jgi:hypothetical protein
MKKQTFDDKIDEMLSRGGFGFWVLCVVFAGGFYVLLWLTMALGIAAGY